MYKSKVKQLSTSVYIFHLYAKMHNFLNMLIYVKR